MASINASAANRIVQCPGCVGEALPSTGSADEGIGAHWVASEMFKGFVAPVGMITPNGVVVTDEMLEAVTMYVDGVLSYAGTVQVEEYLTCASIHPDNKCIPDAYSIDGETLRVFDFKYGHSTVQAKDNFTLVNYAAAIMEKYAETAFDNIELLIIQPRDFRGGNPVRKWSLTVDELQPYIDDLIYAYGTYDSGESTLRTAGSECKYCPVRHSCQALVDAEYDIADYVSTSLPNNLTPNETGRELVLVRRLQLLLDARESGLTIAVEHALKTGGRIEDWSMEPVYGNLAWSLPMYKVVEMASLVEVNVLKKQLITPTQAKKAGLPEAILAACSERKQGSTKLVRSSTTMKGVFGNE